MRSVARNFFGTLMILTSLATATYAGCCKYKYTWPSTYGNPPYPAQGPDGPCSGDIAVSCEEDVQDVTHTDPLARLAYGTRNATCVEVRLLGNGCEFVRASCATPPPNGQFIGVTPGGSCCYVVCSSGHPDYEPWPRSFDVTKCAGDCPPPGSGND